MHLSSDFFFNIVIILFIHLFLLLFKYSCLHFHHTTPFPHPLIPAFRPPTYLLWLCPCVLYTCFLMPFPYYPPLSLFPLLSGYCQFVLYFNVSGCILLACLFCDSVQHIGEIIWYLSFTAWLISLSIMLSSSIHAVTKGRRSFFLSAV